MEDGSNPAGAPLNDWWEIASSGYDGAHYATFSPQLVEPFVKAMGPRRVCRVCGEPERRITETVNAVGENVTRPGRNSAETIVGTIDRNDPRVPDVSERVTAGWTDCGHNDWRVGVVLDPFAGTGTTLSVATGHGLNAVGFDLDERNVDLALERVGPLMLTVVEKGTPLP